MFAAARKHTALLASVDTSHTRTIAIAMQASATLIGDMDNCVGTLFIEAHRRNSLDCYKKYDGVG